MEKSTITIIIPFFNRLEMLKKTIQSVLEQTSDDWSLILVDDGSTENTQHLIEKYTSEKVRFEQRELLPKGAPTSRNTGAKLANSEYIMFLDSDDLLAPWAIEKRIQAIRKDSEHDLYIFEAFEFDNDHPDRHRLRTIYGTKEPLKLFLSFQSVWQTSCVVWKKKVFESIGGWNEQALSWQDGEIHIRYLNKSKDIVWGNSFPDVFIRKHKEKNRISNNTLSLEKVSNLYDTFELLLDTLEDKQMRKLFSNNIDNYLFTIIESLQGDYTGFKSWIRVKFADSEIKTSLLSYLRLCEITPKTPFFNRIIYQFRKFGIPNKRLAFWAIRPRLNSQNFIELKKRIQSSGILSEEIQLL